MIEWGPNCHLDLSLQSKDGLKNTANALAADLPFLFNLEYGLAYV